MAICMHCADLYTYRGCAGLTDPLSVLCFGGNLNEMSSIIFCEK